MPSDATLIAEIADLRQRLAWKDDAMRVLREALKPFAALAGDVKRSCMAPGETYVPCSISLHDFFAARAALAAPAAADENAMLRAQRDSLAERLASRDRQLEAAKEAAISAIASMDCPEGFEFADNCCQRVFDETCELAKKAVLAAPPSAPAEKGDGK